MLLFWGRHRMTARMCPRQSGFTLVELLVVIGIIALLISMLLPALNKVREQAKITMCASNLRQCGVGLMNYTNDSRGMLPTNLDHYFPLYLEAPYYGHELTGKLIALGNGPLRMGPGKLYPKYVTDARIFWCPSLITQELPREDLTLQSIEHYHLPNMIGPPLTVGGFSLGGYSFCAGYRPTPAGGAIWDVKPYIRNKNRAIMYDYFWTPYVKVPNHKKGWNVLTSNHSVQWVPEGEGYTVYNEEVSANYYINKALGAQP